MSLYDDERVRAALLEDGLFDRLVHHDSVGSTNDVALQALRAGEPAGLVVVADRQTAGRGRAGRPWTDDVDGPDGPGNLAVTATLTVDAGLLGFPPLGSFAPLGLVPLAAGLAIAAVYEQLGVSAVLKWPNDVLLAGRKAAGILVERHRIDDREVLLIGCGLDLDWRGVPRHGQAAGWTSVAEVTGQGVDRGAVLAAVLRCLRRRLEDAVDDAAWLRRDYVANCATIGSRIHAALPDGRIVRGLAVGIDDDGRLQIDDGAEGVHLSAGEVTHLRPS